MGKVITQTEARTILRDASTMKTALMTLQFEAGDRKEVGILRTLNETDKARGHRTLDDAEWAEVQRITRKLIVAAKAR